MPVKDEEEPVSPMVAQPVHATVSVRQLERNGVLALLVCPSDF